MNFHFAIIVIVAGFLFSTADLQQQQVCNETGFETNLNPGFNCGNGTEVRFQCCVPTGTSDPIICPNNSILQDTGVMCRINNADVCVLGSSVCGTTTNPNVVRYRAAVIAPAVLIALFGATGILAGLASVAPLLSSGAARGPRGIPRGVPRGIPRPVRIPVRAGGFVPRPPPPPGAAPIIR